MAQSLRKLSRHSTFFTNNFRPIKYREGRRTGVDDVGSLLETGDSSMVVYLYCANCPMREFQRDLHFHYSTIKKRQTKKFYIYDGKEISKHTVLTFEK